MKEAPRKIRTDAWWNRLKDDQVQEAFAMVLQEGIVIAAGLIAAKFGIPRPSTSAMSRFYRYAKGRETQWRIEKAVADKDQISELLKKSGNLDETVRAGLSALALDAIASRDPKMVTEFVSALTGFMSRQEDEKRTALMARKVELLEKRAAQADAADAITKSDLTPEEKDRKFREIFGTR
jgi:hypothetical protein